MTCSEIFHFHSLFPWSSFQEFNVTKWDAEFSTLCAEVICCTRITLWNRGSTINVRKKRKTFSVTELYFQKRRLNLNFMNVSHFHFSWDADFSFDDANVSPRQRCSVAEIIRAGYRALILTNLYSALTELWHWIRVATIN